MMNSAIDNAPKPGDTATLFSVMAFRLTTNEKVYLPEVGLLDHNSIGSARAECREAGATDWMIFSFQAVRASGGWWSPQSKPVVVESTIPRGL